MITKNIYYFFIVFAIIQPINGALIVKHGAIGWLLLACQIFWFIFTVAPTVKFENS